MHRLDKLSLQLWPTSQYLVPQLKAFMLNLNEAATSHYITHSIEWIEVS